MVSFIGAIAMSIAAMIVAVRGVGLFLKCINVLFDNINDGLEERLRRR